MSHADEQRLNAIRGKVARYDFGKTIEVAANMKFLLELIDKLDGELKQVRAEFPLDAKQRR